MQNWQTFIFILSVSLSGCGALDYKKKNSHESDATGQSHPLDASLFAFEGVECRGVGSEYHFDQPLYLGHDCDVKGHFLDGASWEVADLIGSSQNPLLAAISTPQMKVTESGLQLSQLHSFTENSKLTLTLRRVGSADTYTFELNPAQMSDIFTAAQVTLATNIELDPTDVDTGICTERSQKMRKHRDGTVVVRQNEAAIFDLKITPRANMSLKSISNLGTVELDKTPEGLGDFFGLLAPRESQGYFASWRTFADPLPTGTETSIAIRGDKGPTSERFAAHDDNITFVGKLTGKFTSFLQNGLNGPQTPFALYIASSDLSGDIATSLERDNQETPKTILVRNIADYDLRPLSLTAAFTCGTDHFYKTAYGDALANGEAANKQSWVLAPGSTQRIDIKALASKAPLECENPVLETIHLYEQNYLRPGLQAPRVDIDMSSL